VVVDVVHAGVVEKFVRNSQNFWLSFGAGRLVLGQRRRSGPGVSEWVTICKLLRGY
jgi:hypothetical protein